MLSQHEHTIMPKHVDLTGQRFGRLVAIEKIRKNELFHYKCECDCGNFLTVVSGNLTRKQKAVYSCGCARKELDLSGSANPNYRHGHAIKGNRSRTLRIWSGMMHRCYSKDDSSYMNYGGRGIGVADDWHDFKKFLADMGKPPRGLSLDRIDNNSGYSKSNCRWATPTQQTRNQRSNVLITFDGETKTVSEFAEIHKIKEQTLRSRIGYLGWDVSTALLTRPEIGGWNARRSRKKPT